MKLKRPFLQHDPAQSLQGCTRAAHGTAGFLLWDLQRGLGQMREALTYLWDGEQMLISVFRFYPRGLGSYEVTLPDPSTLCPNEFKKNLKAFRYGAQSLSQIKETPIELQGVRSPDPSVSE